MSGKRRRPSKKEYERQEREEADRESKANCESENRQARMAVLWQELRKKQTQARIRKAVQTELGATLLELIDLQKKEIQYLVPFRCERDKIHTHFREQLENLRSARIWAEIEQLINTGVIKIRQPTPTQQHEWKRRVHRWADVGLIEYEFGGAGEAEWRRSIPGVLSLHLQPTCFGYQPTCLDEIFSGGRVNTRRLQDLFGVNCNRFPKDPSVKNGRERSYNHHAIVKIMNALLSEKRKSRGRRLQTWPSDPNIRTRMLNGIAERVKIIAREKDIIDAFVTLVPRHCPDSAKK